MNNQTELYENLVWSLVCRLKQKDCFGCNYNKGSQKHHECLSSTYDDSFTIKALKQLYLEGKIPQDYYESKLSEVVRNYYGELD